MNAQSRGESRYQPLAAAVVFAVALIVGFQLNNPPDFTASDATWTAFWSSRTHRVEEIVGGYALFVAGCALVWFATLLARRVGSDTVRRVAYLAAPMLWIGDVLWRAVPVAKSISGAPSPGPDLARMTTDLGADAISMVAAPLIGFVIVAACVAGRRTGALARPVVWTGFAIAVLGGVGGVAMLPMLLLPVWVLAAGADLSLRRPRAGAAIAAAA